MKLVDLYDSLLEAAGMTTDKDGMVSIVTDTGNTPMTVGGKRLVVPTRERMRVISLETCELFHPLGEHLIGNEHEVLTSYREALNYRLNSAFGMLMIALLTLATSPDEHRKLTPDQTLFLSKVKKADEKTVKDVERILRDIPLSQLSRMFVHIFLKKGGTAQGRTYKRVGVVSFPFYEALVSMDQAATDRFKGMAKLRVGDREALIELFQFLIPGIDDAGNYNHGSDSTVAPFLEALMQSYGDLAGVLNAHLESFSSVIPELADLVIPSEWSKYMDNLQQYNSELQLLPSTPAAAAAQAGPGPSVPTVPPAPIPVQALAQQPYQQPLQAQPHPTGVVYTSKGLDLAATMRNQQPQFSQGFQQQPGINPMAQGRATPNNPVASYNHGCGQQQQTGFGQSQFGNNGRIRGGGVL